MVVICDSFVSIMAKNIGKYREVTQLPVGAMSVKCYADLRGWQPHNIYMRLNRHKNDFEIILFQGINFVIPINNQ